jgi:hypothetical protein
MNFSTGKTLKKRTCHDHHHFPATDKRVKLASQMTNEAMKNNMATREQIEEVDRGSTTGRKGLITLTTVKKLNWTTLKRILLPFLTEQEINDLHLNTRGKKLKTTILRSLVLTIIYQFFTMYYLPVFHYVLFFPKSSYIDMLIDRVFNMSKNQGFTETYFWSVVSEVSERSKDIMSNNNNCQPKRNEPPGIPPQSKQNLPPAPPPQLSYCFPPGVPIINHGLMLNTPSHQERKFTLQYPATLTKKQYDSNQDASCKSSKSKTMGFLIGRLVQSSPTHSDDRIKGTFHSNAISAFDVLISDTDRARTIDSQLTSILERTDLILCLLNSTKSDICSFSFSIVDMIARDINTIKTKMAEYVQGDNISISMTGVTSLVPSYSRIELKTTIFVADAPLSNFSP